MAMGTEGLPIASKASMRALFSIDSTGQIKTKSALNFEEKTSYSVRVKVSDNDGGSVFARRADHDHGRS